MLKLSPSAVIVVPRSHGAEDSAHPYITSIPWRQYATFASAMRERGQGGGCSAHQRLRTARAASGSRILGETGMPVLLDVHRKAPREGKP